jgi:hypothetical protein
MEVRVHGGFLSPLVEWAVGRNHVSRDERSEVSYTPIDVEVTVSKVLRLSRVLGMVRDRALAVESGADASLAAIGVVPEPKNDATIDCALKIGNQLLSMVNLQLSGTGVSLERLSMEAILEVEEGEWPRAPDGTIYAAQRAPIWLWSVVFGDLDYAPQREPPPVTREIVQRPKEGRPTGPITKLDGFWGEGKPLYFSIGTSDGIEVQTLVGRNKVHWHKMSMGVAYGLRTWILDRELEVQTLATVPMVGLYDLGGIEWFVTAPRLLQPASLAPLGAIIVPSFTDLVGDPRGAWAARDALSAVARFRL